MTREEAIKDIQDNILPVVGGGKSLAMAISALRQPDPCGDVVSRNAIIQKLNQMDRYVSAELRLCDTDKKFPQNEVFIVDDVYEEIAEQLPSAQPERKDALEKAVAVEAISDVLMSRFDISATYAYDVAESAVNRIEVMAKEMGKR